MKDLGRKILRNRLVARVFASGFEVYLVGGYLRDIVRGASSGDADFIFRGEAEELRSWLSANIGGTVVEFRRGPVLRIVSGRGSLDFSKFGGSIEEDLSSRDFTMNAMAWSPERGLIDPLKGSRDIEKETIRAVSKKNLQSDPLRLLRAYRFAAELGWKIDPRTRGLIRELKALIRRPARERITLELFRVFDSSDPSKTLRAAHFDGILKELIICNNSQLNNNVKVTYRFGRFLDEIHDKYHFNFETILSQGLSLRGLVWAELLLFGADLKKSRLDLSTPLRKRFKAFEMAVRRYMKDKDLTSEGFFDLFEEAGSSAMDFAIHTRKEQIVAEAQKFLFMRPYLSTEEIMHLSGLRTGPGVGLLLRKLRRMQFGGSLRSANETRRWLMRMSAKEGCAE